MPLWKNCKSKFVRISEPSFRIPLQTTVSDIVECYGTKINGTAEGLPLVGHYANVKIYLLDP